MTRIKKMIKIQDETNKDGLRIIGFRWVYKYLDEFPMDWLYYEF